MSRVEAGTLYGELPLSLSSHSLRLWKFCTSSSDEVLEVQLVTFDPGTHPKYKALSYEWGSLEDAKEIVVNGFGLRVSKNLHDFLTVLEQESSQAWFWADQISLDQSNLKERNHQVGYMGQIYAEAEEVLAYVGSAIQALETDSDYRELWFSDLFTKPDFEAYVATWPSVSPARVTEEICSRAYWRRLWIVQELRLASAARFYFGTRSISREQLRSHLEKFDKARWLVNELRDDANMLAKALLSPYLAEKQLSFAQAFLNFGASTCSDKRDKVFGLQALIRPEERISIDYGRTLGSVIYEVHTRLGTTVWDWANTLPGHLTPHHGKRFLGTHSDDIITYRVKQWTAQSMQIATWFDIKQPKRNIIAWHYNVTAIIHDLGIPTREQTLCDYWNSLWHSLLACAPEHRQQLLAEHLLRAFTESTAISKVLDNIIQQCRLAASDDRGITPKTTIAASACARCGSKRLFGPPISSHDNRAARLQQLNYSFEYQHLTGGPRIEDMSLVLNQCPTCLPVVFQSFKKLRRAVGALLVHIAMKHGYEIVHSYMYHKEEWPLNVDET